ncbi:MAG TPA: hypothetical protein VGI66_04155 [Streptosporangiaceae bacterium]
MRWGLTVLLIVMFETGTWRLHPDQRFTFGRAASSTAALPNDDRGVSRNAGSFEWRAGCWWLTNASASSMLYLSGDRGFRADIPPGMSMPIQQWHAKVRIDGMLASYTIRVRLPDLDEEPDEDETDEQEAAEPASEVVRERTVTSTKLRAPLSESDRLVLAARFEQYLTWKHPGAASPRSARETGERIGWQPHTVSKRCENIRNRYVRIGVPGLRGPRALDELAALLISTGELTGDDLRRLPPKPAAGQPATAQPATAQSAGAQPAAAESAAVQQGNAQQGSAQQVGAEPGGG